VSQGTTGGNGSYDAYFDGESTDGSRVFFESFEPLTGGDADASPDVYERYGGVTTLISTAPSGSDSYYATFMGASDDGTRVFFDTADPVLSSDTDANTDVYEAIAGNYPRPKGATPLSVPLVIAYRDCTSPNSVHGPPPLSTNPTDASCAPPVQESGWLTVGTGDSNARASNGTGKVRFESIVGDPSTSADEADLRLKLSLTDARNKSDLSDYTGEVQVRATVRITDKENAGGSVPGTVTDIPFSWDAPCTATADTGIGSACAVTTSADALMPGAITEGARSVWEVGQIEVYDGGSDGDTATAPNTVFERQGIFIP